MRRSAFWVAASAWSLAAMLLSRAAAAGPPAAIVVTFDADSVAQGQAVVAIRAHMSGLPVEVVSVPVERGPALDERLATSGALAASRHALGTFDIEAGEDDSLLIFFTEADGETTLIRRLRPNHQGARVALEQAAIVVRSLVEALLEGGTVGIAAGADHSFEPGRNEQTPGEAAAAPSTSTPALTDRSASPPPEHSSGEGSTSEHLALTAGYTTTQFATGVPWQSGLSVGAQWLATPAFYGAVRYTFFPSMTLASADAAVSIGRYPLEVLVGYHERGRLALNAELGVVADRVTRATVRTAATWRATSPDARWVLAMAARGGFSWSPWTPLRASMRVGADFVLMRYAYVVDAGEPALSPAWVRPRLELELAACVW